MIKAVEPVTPKPLVKKKEWIAVGMTKQDDGRWAPLQMLMEGDRMISSKIIDEAHDEKIVAQDRLEVRIQELFPLWK